MTPTASLPTGYADREVTQPPNWHGLVVMDVFLNALATGSFLVAAAAELVRPERFTPVAAWVYPATLVFLLADLLCLVLDLGNPSRFHHMLRVFKPLSPMSLGTWFLTAYSLPLTALVAADLLTWAGWWPADAAILRRALLVVGLPCAFGAAAYKGVLFSTTAQPGWRDARWLGAYHTTGALVFGGAVVLIAGLLTGHGAAVADLRPALAGLVVINLVPLGLLAAELRPALSRVYTRSGQSLFILAVVSAGGLLPVALLFAGIPLPPVAAALLLLVAGYAVRSVVVHLPHKVHAHPGN